MNPESPSNRPISHSTQSKRDDVNLVKLFFLILSNWYWYILALSLMLLAAWLYNRYTPPTWQVTATVLIEDDQKNQSSIPTSLSY